ncbi:MAG: T9SS type A sorting domain-containing protein [Bacteroidales bacterium]|nr:T9SS type A sorting domain-containing protein [Bacteroidales bacterium]
MKGLLYIIAVVSCTLTAGAQSQGIVAAASSGSINGSVALSWIIGQTFASSATAADKSVILTQGQQDRMVITDNNENSTTRVKVHFYPIPAGDVLTMKFDEAVSGEIRVMVVDVKGNTVKSDIIEAAMTEKQLDLKGISSGIYYIRLTLGNSVNVYKVVKL